MRLLLSLKKIAFMWFVETVINVTVFFLSLFLLINTLYLMILINKNSANTCILTLSERTTLTNAKYLFEFINDSTKQTKTFLCADISTNKERFNEFVITENTTENLLTGTVSLTIGDWKYNIYQQTSTTNLIVANSGALVENGKVEVKGTSTDLAEFTSEQTTYKEFNG